MTRERCTYLAWRYWRFLPSPLRFTIGKTKCSRETEHDGTGFGTFHLPPKASTEWYVIVYRAATATSSNLNSHYRTILGTVFSSANQPFCRIQPNVFNVFCLGARHGVLLLGWHDDSDDEFSRALQHERKVRLHLVFAPDLARLCLCCCVGMVILRSSAVHVEDGKYVFCRG